MMYLKKIIIVVLVFLIVGSINLFLYFNNKKIYQIHQKKYDVKIIDTIKETSKKEKIANVENKKEDEKVINEEQITSVPKESTKTIIENNTTSNNSNTKKEEIIIRKSKEEKGQTTGFVNNKINEEVVAETIQKETPKYIGVPDPNNFYYSFHNGKTDDAYTTLEGCYNKSIEVNFLDTVDIINSTCYEVLDGQGIVLGIYMQVKCNSGNCEKYKKQVGINTN